MLIQVARVDVGDEADIEGGLGALVEQGLADQARPQVRAADAQVDDSVDGFFATPRVLAGTDALCEGLAACPGGGQVLTLVGRRGVPLRKAMCRAARPSVKFTRSPSNRLRRPSGTPQACASAIRACRVALSMCWRERSSASVQSPACSAWDASPVCRVKHSC